MKRRQISEAARQEFKASLEVPDKNGTPFLPQTDGKPMEAFCAALEDVLRELAPEKEPLVEFYIVGSGHDYCIRVSWMNQQKGHREYSFSYGRNPQELVDVFLQTPWGQGLLLYTGVHPETHCRELTGKVVQWGFYDNRDVRNSVALLTFTDWLDGEEEEA